MTPLLQQSKASVELNLSDTLQDCTRRDVHTRDMAASRLLKQRSQWVLDNVGGKLLPYMLYLQSIASACAIVASVSANSCLDLSKVYQFVIDCCS